MADGPIARTMTALANSVRAKTGVTGTLTGAQMLEALSVSPWTNSFITRDFTEMEISPDTQYIGDFAFAECRSLASVVIPDSVTRMGRGAFLNCKALETVRMPVTLDAISYEAFYGCKSLSSITIPEGVTTIEGSAFEGCSSLSSITIPESVTTIEDWAFRLLTIHFRFRCSESEVPDGYPWEAWEATAEYNYTGD